MLVLAFCCKRTTSHRLRVLRPPVPKCPLACSRSRRFEQPAQVKQFIAPCQPTVFLKVVGVLTQLDLLKYWKENTMFDLAGSEGVDGMKVVNIKLQVDLFVFPLPGKTR